jgi:hypothetical protein
MILDMAIMQFVVVYGFLIELIVVELGAYSATVALYILVLLFYYCL